MACHRFILNVVALLLLTGLGMGSLDESGRIAETNMTLSEFSDQVPQGIMSGDFADLGAPANVASDAGSDVALYTDQAPSEEAIGILSTSEIESNPPTYMYLNGDYMSWNDFAMSFPGSQPGLWIKRAVGWSMYATLPWGGWTQVLIYLPKSSSVYMYEIHPSGFVSAYKLGHYKSGFYTLWYLADEPGRHTCVISTKSGYSNQIIIDVFWYENIIKKQRINPTPKPDPKKECEARGWPWVWQDGQCKYMSPVPDPVAECEARGSGWQWIDGKCQFMPGPVPNPTPEPMPGPVPNPTPEPEPFNPAPNPVAECESIPGCYWINGQCLCTGLGTSSSSGSGDAGSYTSSNPGATS